MRPRRAAAFVALAVWTGGWGYQVWRYLVDQEERMLRHIAEHADWPQPED